LGNVLQVLCDLASDRLLNIGEASDMYEHRGVVFRLTSKIPQHTGKNERINGFDKRRRHHVGTLMSWLMPALMALRHPSVNGIRLSVISNQANKRQAVDSLIS
jgi:hypothetical protein